MEYSCFLVLLVSCLAFFGAEASHNVLDLQLSQSQSQQPDDDVNVKLEHRTGYHFQPTKHWINDPNGPMFYKGFYHLFYQYNPKGAVWGNIVWAHSVSSDLINWKRLENAIYPAKWFDRYGCWSGSATILPGNKPIILYTGIIHENKTQVQNYAIPADESDPFLRQWIKPDNNPIIRPDHSINQTSFRDPTTAWRGGDGRWRIALGGLRKHRGVAYLYRSKDFKHWVKAQHPLHSRNGTGNWECPDFYPVSVLHKYGLDSSVPPTANVKHVLKVSLDLTRYEYYTLGTYDARKDRYVPDEAMIDGWNGLRHDYGNFYASKSFYDPMKRRRILWAWANESDTTDNDISKGWAGVQVIPRTIVLDPNGKQLVHWPIEEVESLRSKKAAGVYNWELSKGEKLEIKGLSTTAEADVDVTFAFDSLDNAEEFNSSWDRYDAQKLCGDKDSTVEGAVGPFGLITLASQNLEEYTPVFFRIFKDQHKHILLMCSDASRSSLGDPKTQMEDGHDAYRPSFGGFVDVDLEEKKISLRSLIDNSVVESFAAKGKTCITSRVYPQLALGGNAHLYVFNNGTEKLKIESLNAWSMSRPAQMNQ